MKALVTFALLALFAITGEAVETHWNFLSVVSYGPDCHHLVSDFSGFEMCVDVYGSSLGICDHSSYGGGIVALGKEGSTVTTGTIPQGQLSITAPLNFDQPFFVIFQVNATDLSDKPTLYGWADLTVNTDHSVTINRSAITDADSILVGAIPEPTSGLLLLVGAALLALRRRNGDWFKNASRSRDWLQSTLQVRPKLSSRHPSFVTPGQTKIVIPPPFAPIRPTRGDSRSDCHSRSDRNCQKESVGTCPRVYWVKSRWREKAEVDRGLGKPSSEVMNRRETEGLQ